MTVWRERISREVPKATNTQSEYVIHIASPPLQWLQERASMLRYAYVASLVKNVSEYESSCKSVQGDPS